MKTCAILRLFSHPSSKSLVKRSIAALVASQSARADSLYWDGTGTGWEVVANWSTAAKAATPNPPAVPGAGDIAVFGISTIASGTPQTINLNALQSALGLVFGNFNPVSANVTTYTLQGGGSDRTLTLGTSGIQVINPLAR